MQFFMKDLEPLIIETVNQGFTFTMLPKGTSMLPLFREGEDSVILSALPEKVVAGDVILYKRENEQYVLHRVMMVKGDTFVMCGDNQSIFEKGITRENMIAIASGMIRDGEEIDFSKNEKYLSYVKRTLSEKKRKNVSCRFKSLIKKILMIK